MYGPVNVCWYEFPVLEKYTILLFERNKPIIKIPFTDTSKPYNCGSSVKVNSINDDILLNFKWLNAKCLLHQEETTINMRNFALSEVSDGPYCNSDVNKGTETYAALVPQSCEFHWSKQSPYILVHAKTLKIYLLICIYFFFGYQ